MSELLMVGDSFQAPTNPADGWPVCAELLGQRLGLTVANRAVPGAGYVATGILGPNARRRYSQQLLVNPPPDPKLVIVFGSVNDAPADNVELCTTAFVTLLAAMQQYPRARHVWVGPQWSGPDPVPANVFRARDDILQAVWGLPFQMWRDPVAENWFPRNRPELWAADRFHPNAAGQVRMADLLEPSCRQLLAP